MFLFKIKKFIRTKKNGFTFLEVIIAVFVISIGVLAVFNVSHLPISQISVSISKLTATYLAQEGIEIVRNIRDTNWLKEGESWDNDLGRGDWEADYETKKLDDNYNGDFLRIDSKGFYNYSSGTSTKFKRKITILPDKDSEGIDILKVTVLVDWQEKGKTYNTKVQENLYEWYENGD